MNSINFKCQQEKEKAKKRPLPILFQPKKAKLDQSDTAATAIEQNLTFSNHISMNTEFGSISDLSLAETQIFLLLHLI